MSKDVFGQQGYRALTFALAKLSCLCLGLWEVRKSHRSRWK